MLNIRRCIKMQLACHTAGEVDIAAVTASFLRETAFLKANRGFRKFLFGRHTISEDCKMWVNMFQRGDSPHFELTIKCQYYNVSTFRVGFFCLSVVFRQHGFYYRQRLLEHCEYVQPQPRP